MAAFAGLRGTGDWGTDERPKNFREMILWRDPNGMTPLLALMAKMRKETVNDPEFSHWEEQLSVNRLQVNGALASGATTVAVDDGADSLVPGTLLLAELATEPTVHTEEVIEVTARTNDTTFDVTRGAAGTTAAAIADNAFLTVVGSAYGEGTGAPDVTAANPTKLHNLTQIFKHAFEETGTVLETHARTGSVLKNDKRRKSFEHAIAIELAMMWGNRFETVGANGKPKRYMGGLRQFLTSHTKIYGSTPDEDQLLDDIHPIFDYNAEGAGNERIVLAGNGALNTLNKIALASPSTRLNSQGSIKMFGMELDLWKIPQGKLAVRTHPLMNVHPRMKNSMFILNPRGLIYRPLQNRDTKIKQNVQANDMDTRKDMWITECGIEVHHELTMMYIGNLV